MKKRAPAPAERAPALAFRIALAFAALGVALIGAELFARQRFQKKLETLRFTESDLYYYYDPKGHRHNIPGKTGYERMWNDQGRAEFRINALGFRGEEVPKEKLESDHRILFLGDSITLGGRLPDNETFVGRIRQALAPRSLLRYQVFNAGVGDVGLEEEEETLRGKGIAARPDVVVLCWYLNDARPAVGFPEEIVYGDPFIRWFHRQTWLRGSYAAGAVYDARRGALVSRGLEAAPSRRFDWIEAYKSGRWMRDPAAFQDLTRMARFDWGDAWSDASLAWMAERIIGLRDFCEKNGVKFAVVLLPVQAQVYTSVHPETAEKPQRALVKRLDAASIANLDLLTPLKAVSHSPSAGQIFYDQCHYTPNGNAIVARLILDFLQEKRLLQK